MDTPIRLRSVAFGSFDPIFNMALDTHLLGLCSARPDCGFLRFYTWSPPAVSLGFSEDAAVVDLDRARADGVQVVRRPTGGRAVFHGDDLTYAAVVPSTGSSRLPETYRLLSECLMIGIGRLGPVLEITRGSTGRTRLRHRPCFTSASRYEVTFDGRKVVGSAQRVTERAVLQHGSIPLGRGYLRVVDYMACDSRERADLLRATESATCCLCDLIPTHPDPAVLASVLMEGFRTRFEVTDENLGPETFL